MISIGCPHCAKLLKVKDELAGKRVKCPGCGTPFTVPAASESAPSASGSRKLSPVPAGGVPSDEERTLPPKPPAVLASEAPTLAPNGPIAGPPAGVHLSDVTAGGDPGPDGGDNSAELTSFLAPPQASDEIGRLGPYRVLSILGHGGMGVVFRAEDPGLKRLVALKVMLPALAKNASNRARFLREAQAAAAVRDDHVVAIHQVSEDRGVPFVAMEFLHGEPLDVRIRREPPLTIPEILRIGRETALGLSAAHDRGLIHRDIKPGNLWLETSSRRRSGDFRVKILDFGLARALAEETHLTQTGAIVGTPAYMAPEQAGGRDIDHRCDLFSLGCVLYRLCSGEMAFKGKDTIAIVSALALDTPRPPHEANPGVPPALSELVLQMLAKKPDDRPASAEEVAHALQALEAEFGEPAAPSKTRVASAPRATSPRRSAVDDGARTVAQKAGLRKPRASTPGRKRRWPLLVGIGGGTLAVLLALIFILSNREASPPEKREDGQSNSTPITDHGPTPKPANSFELTKDQQAFLDNLKLLPPEVQQKEVIAKLQQINGIFGPFYEDDHLRLPEFKVESGKPVAVKITDWRMSVLWPLLAFPSLTSIDLSNAAVSDLTPLTKLPELADLKIELAVYNPDADAVMKSIPTLKNINGQPAAEYCQQRAAARKEIDDMAAKVSQFSPEGTAGWLTAQLKKLNPKFAGKAVPHGIHNLENHVGYWKEGGVTNLEFNWISNITDISPVRALPFDTLTVGAGPGGDHVRTNRYDLAPLKGLPLKSLLFVGRVRDLAPLRGMKLTKLWIEGPVTDLAPLAGMPLESIRFEFHNMGLADLASLKDAPLTDVAIRRSRVSDLSPLAGMKLKSLVISGSMVSDISVLKGMPLENLAMERGGEGGRKVADISVLRGMPLKRLCLDVRPYFEPDLQLLKSLPLEEHLLLQNQGKTVAQYWQEFDVQRQTEAKFIESLSKLPPDEQAKGVQKTLHRHNDFKHVVSGNAVTEVSLEFFDNGGDLLWPLRAFPKLRKLTLKNSENLKQIDLSPLTGLPLEELHCGGLVEYNLPVLRTMKSLKTINGRPAAEVLAGKDKP